MSELAEITESKSPMAYAGSVAASIYENAEKFDLTQRAAKMFASSTMVPKEYHGNLANCAIAINIAERLKADPFAVMQSMDVIHGRPSWRSTFLIAMVNASGRFSPLQFKLEGKGESLSCYAWAKTLSDGEEVKGPTVTMQMAKDEGWISKNGSKWKTMPEVMIRYRAASFFAKLYAPDITLGMQTAEELQDISYSAKADIAKPAIPEGNPFEEKPSVPEKEDAKAEEESAGSSQQEEEVELV